MQGMDITIESYNGEDGQYLSEVKGNGMTFQKQVFDGEKGQLTSMQGAQMMDDEQLENMKYESKIFPELDYLKEEYTLELKGMDSHEGKDVLVIEVTKPNGESQTNYYDKESGYLVKSVTILESPQGSFTQTSVLSDYQKVGKIMYPHKIDQSTGPQTMNIKVTEVEVNPKLNKSLFKISE
jgi:hypothetical protein